VPTNDSQVPSFLCHLVDDAAVFPPGSAPLDEALRAHLEHRAAWYGDLLGPLVVRDADLSRLEDLVPAAAPGEALRLAVVVSGGAGALEPAVTWAARGEHLDLVAVEVAVRESDAGDLAPNARRIVTAVDSLISSGLLDEDVAVYVEPPRLHGAQPSASWLAALDEVAATDHRLKLRTGGLDPDTVPTADELATCIGAALDRELTFKCTAGLHRAVRHRDAHTGVDEHGFLNVLLATRASLDGAGPADVAGVLEERDTAAVTGSLSPDALTSARRWFTSFGSCSVAEPLQDLASLGLLETP
jgi:hypothetical protein